MGFPLYLIGIASLAPKIELLCIDLIARIYEVKIANVALHLSEKAVDLGVHTGLLECSLAIECPYLH